MCHHRLERSLLCASLASTIWHYNVCLAIRIHEVNLTCRLRLGLNQPHKFCHSPVSSLACFALDWAQVGPGLSRWHVWLAWNLTWQPGIHCCSPKLIVLVYRFKCLVSSWPIGDKSICITMCQIHVTIPVSVFQLGLAAQSLNYIHCFRSTVITVVH